MPPRAEEEMEEIGESGEGPAAHKKSLQEYLDLSIEQQQDLIVAIMQLGFSSMAISLLATGMIFLCVVAGLRDATTINALIYTSWASLGAIGLISVMVVLLNVVTQFAED